MKGRSYKKGNNIREIVKAILENDPQAMNDDSLLYLRVLEQLDKLHHTKYCQLPVAVFLQAMPMLNVPPFETVRRTRQRISERGESGNESKLQA